LGLAKRLKPGLEKMTSDRAGRPATLADLLDMYLSFDHPDNLAAGCPMSASASEVARQSKIVSERFTEGFEQVAALIERGLEDSPVTDKHQRALAMMAAMIGGVAASRAVAKADPKLSNEILRADLPARIKQRLPLGEYDRNTFYTFDARGYIDYPAYTAGALAFASA
jgi:TetR/AcrR family transcriptional repressor of nem operon